jgi:hypothetical protein
MVVRVGIRVLSSIRAGTCEDTIMRHAILDKGLHCFGESPMFAEHTIPTLDCCCFKLFACGHFDFFQNLPMRRETLKCQHLLEKPVPLR